MTDSPTSGDQMLDRVARLGFGCCPMGQHGWGEVDERDLICAVHVALDLGVTLFDTADIYGFGVSEATLGKALGSRRHEAIVATKFGVRHRDGQTTYDTSPAWIRQAIDGSLRRLGTEFIDLYQMHYWDGKTPLEEIVLVLESLRAAGKIRAYGVTNFDPRHPAFLQFRRRPAAFSYQYSLIDRDLESEIIKVQLETGITFLSWGSLSQGLLSGNHSNRNDFHPCDRRRREVYANFHGERFIAVQALIENMRQFASDAGIGSLTQLALRWVIDKIPRGLPLVGIKRPEQIRDAAGVLEFALDPALLRQLDTLTAEYRARLSSCG